MTTDDLLASQTEPSKQRELRICLAVWPNFAERPDWQQNDLMRDVANVEAGRATPCLSHVERVAVLEAWKDEAPRAEGFLYRWAGAASRADSPSVAALEADGWTVEHVDPRYGTRLMKKAT